MEAKSYIDVEALGSEDVHAAVVAGRVFHVLHGAFGSAEGRYAVAFPKSHGGNDHRTIGSVVRVFSDSSQALYDLIEKVKGHHVMRDYTRMSMPRDVPADFSGAWVSYRRIQIVEKECNTRTKAIKNASRAPYFEIRSSSGHVFPMRILREKTEQQVGHFTPNSYGLAAGGNRNGQGRNMFSLPDLP